MKIFDIFKKKEPSLPFKEWDDLPAPYTKTNGQNEFDFKKKYSIINGVKFQVKGKPATIKNITDGNIIDFTYDDGRTEIVYLEDFNKFEVVVIRDDLVDENYVSFAELKDYVEEDNYDGIISGFKYHHVSSNQVKELLRYAATHGRINSIKAAVNSSLDTTSLSNLMITSAEQGQLEILKYLVNDIGINPTYKNNAAIKVVGDNVSNREFLLNDQRVIDRLIKDGHTDLLPDSIKDIFVF